jgi:hypothetical protein
MKAERAAIVRVCARPGCDRDFGATGTLPYEACVHFEGGTFAVTCSKHCRMALGWRAHRPEEPCPEPCALCGTEGA